MTVNSQQQIYSLLRLPAFAHSLKISELKKRGKASLSNTGWGPSIKYVITFFAIFDNPLFLYQSASTFSSIFDPSPLKSADVLHGELLDEKQPSLCE